MNNSLKLVTYNIRCCWDRVDGINVFLMRQGLMLQKIKQEKPDVICFQEVIEPIYDFLSEHLSDYALIYNQRCEGYTGEGLVVAVKKSTARIITVDSFWLSKTPYVPGSRYENQSDCPRVCQMLHIKSLKSGKDFYVCNNHLDHISDEARILGIKQVLEFVSEKLEKHHAPIFIIGDFNAEPDSETIKYCNSYEKIPLRDITSHISHSFHDFGRRETPCKIDYIYTDKATANIEHQVYEWLDELNGVYLSDHYPIAVEIEI